MWQEFDFYIQIEAINTKAEGITSWSYELLMEKLHSDSDCSLTYANTNACNQSNKGKWKSLLVLYVK